MYLKAMPGTESKQVGIFSQFGYQQQQLSQA
jgi:hypothetical protein